MSSQLELLQFAVLSVIAGLIFTTTALGLASEDDSSASQLVFEDGTSNIEKLAQSKHEKYFKQSDEALNDFVKQVHIVFMNHLDVGYTNLINVVLNTYFVEYFPRVIQIIENLRKGGYVESFIYTTHPWLVTLYLDCPPNLVLANVPLKCPTAAQKRAFINAVNEGYITWHAGPFNLQVEMAHEPWLFDAGLDISAQLDKKLNVTRRVRVLSQRDVPGLTQAAIPLMVKKGITALTVGVNPMTPPPAFPNGLFVWKYGKDSIIGTLHRGGYPNEPGSDPAHPGGLSRRDCVVVDGFSHALCFAFRTDNNGPPKDVAEVLKYYEILRAEFPNAKLAASTLDDYFEVAQSMRDKLPIVSAEASDTWIQGVASDPRKCAEYRAIARVMRNCFAAGECSMGDARVWNASRFLIKLPEHTWGLPSEHDSVNWANDKFHKLRDKSPNFVRSAMSWQEQRHFAYLAIDALEDHPVRAGVKTELDELYPRRPDLSDYWQVMNMTQTFDCPNVDIKKIKFGPDGSVTKLITSDSQWSCDDDCHLGRVLYVSFNETDYNEFGKVYNYLGGSAGYYKSNLTANAHPESKNWPAVMTGLFRRRTGFCEFYVHIQMAERRSVEWYGAPQDIWMRYVARSNSNRMPGIDIDLQFFNKTSTRLPEALLLEFKPSRARTWSMSKMNLPVDPLGVMLNGSQYQHVLDDNGVGFDSSDDDDSAGAPHLARFRSPDVPIANPVVKGDVPHVFPAPLQPLPGPLAAFAFNVYNNIWETNYVMWYPYRDADANFRARFYVDV